MAILAKAADIRSMDSLAVNRGLLSEEELMDNAASVLFRRIKSELSVKERGFGKTVIVCGGGNNGGDGYALSKILLSEKIQCDVIALYPPRSSEAVRRSALLRNSGKSILSFEYNGADAKDAILNSDTIIDAVFGVGYQCSRLPDDNFIHFVRWVKKSEAFVVSVDMPSGISSDDAGFSEIDGVDYPICIKADMTVTFAASKPGLESQPGIFFAGKVFVEDIKIPDEVMKVMHFSAKLSSTELFSIIPPRRIDSNKGSYGKLMSFCGSQNMTGAAVLSALGALSGGVGLMTCLAIDSVKSVLQNCVPEVTFIPLFELAGGVIDTDRAAQTLESYGSSMSSVLIGCGIGRERSARRLIDILLEYTSCPVVLDADGLNILADDIAVFKKHGGRMIITPHPGEMARLLNTDVSHIQKNRISSADFFSKEFGAIVVLKGFRTVICAPDGRIYLNPTGNPGMAKAGMGDVLAGLIASLAAQKLDLFTCAALGAYVHGIAGDMAADELGRISMKASDLPCYIGKVFKDK